jgi:hypothetical protein
MGVTKPNLVSKLYQRNKSTKDLFNEVQKNEQGKNH